MAEEKSNKVVWGIIIGVVTVVILVSWASVAGFTLFEGNGEYDIFAQCLTDSGAKMFGAYWCPHCQSQKDIFGSSWKHVDYVECSLPNRAGQTQVCIDEGITSYPTWEFASGQRVGGVIGLEQLSQLSGCSLE